MIFIVLLWLCNHIYHLNQLSFMFRFFKILSADTPTSLLPCANASWISDVKVDTLLTLLADITTQDLTEFALLCVFEENLCKSSELVCLVV